jgi:hypothetical protein
VGTLGEGQEDIMSSGPTSSNSLGLIGVELYRLHVGSVSATNFVFAAVQTDWRYLAWYSFFDDSSSDDDFRSRWREGDNRAADDYGTGFGQTKHEFRRVFLRTTRAIRVDGLTGDDKTSARAVMFVRNSLKKGHVLVDIDIARTDGFLQLRRLDLGGPYSERVRCQKYSRINLQGHGSSPLPKKGAPESAQWFGIAARIGGYLGHRPHRFSHRSFSFSLSIIDRSFGWRIDPGEG